MCSILAKRDIWRIPILMVLLLTAGLVMLFPTVRVHAQDSPPAGGAVDGEWSYPRNDLGVTPVTCQDINNSPADPTDENVMRYGQQLGASGCGELIFRSGFGFDGADNVTFTPATPFLLGQFTHYNENIVTPLVPMQFVDLTVNFQSSTPAIDVQMSYTMRLDETLNTGACLYGSTNNDLCDDRVDFVNNTPAQTVVIDGMTYTLNIVGFTPGTMDNCQYNEDIVDYFITGEMMRNDACVFAEFVVPEPAITIEKSPDLQQVLIADYAEFTITVTNTGNVGFNQAFVTDPLTPDCDRAIEGFKSGDVETYFCTAYDVMQDFDNVATASAVFDGNEYSAMDSARIDVLAPDTASFYAVKYHDQNSNGQRDAGEPGLYGWTLCVKDNDGAIVGFCQVTDPAGQATLAPNRAGEFLLCEEPQPGWINTDPGDGTACKPFSITEAPLYVELYPTDSDIYGVELTETSPAQTQWNYTVYQYFESNKLDEWMLSLPSCIDAAQIDAVATTPGWSFVDEPAAGLHGVRWQTPAGVDPIEGGQFTLALLQPHPTGAASARITMAGPPPINATDAIAGPACHPIVQIGNATELPASGQLEVRKQVLPANDNGYFNLAIDSVIYATDVQNGGTTGKQPVPSGVHIVGEGAGAQTELDDYIRGLSCTEMNSGATWTPAATGEVNVDVDDDVVCTFTNIRRGVIRVGKQVVGVASADWSFTSNTLGAFTLPAAGGQRDFARLAPGLYSVAESAVAGWGLAGLTCTDPDNGTVTDLANGLATIDLDPGETVVCIFDNVADAGSVTIVKEVTGVGDSPWFFESALGAFTLPAAGGARTFEGVAPGVYNVLESAKESWHVAAINCTDPDSETTVDTLAGRAIIDLDANEHVTCTFVNAPGRPNVTLDKSASANIIYPNHVVTYTFAVRNTGQVPLRNVRVEDDQCTVLPATSDAHNTGDVDQDDLLDVGEQWSFTCARALAEDTTNTATAWAEAPWGESVWSTDSVAVDVIAPQIALKKSADREVVHAGETVNYQIVTRNSGDTPLYNVVVEDGLAECTLVGPTGDNGNAALDPGEAWAYTCAMILTEETINLATVTGNDALGNPWYAEDRVTVEVYTPEIQVTKLADRAFVYPNEAINFTVKVRNVGNTPLNTVNVTDSLPQCALVGPTGDDGDAQLAVGEEWTYTCMLTVCPGETPAVGGAGAGDVSGSAVTVDVTKAWDVASAEPELAPACTDPPPTLVGPSFGSCWSPTNRWFELTVVNKALIPAHIGYDIYRSANSFRKLGRFDVGQRSVFTVTQEGTLRKYISANGQTNWQQLGGTHTLDIAGHIAHGYLCPEAPPPIPPICSDVTNIVEVTAKDATGREVRDKDSAFVNLIHPGIDVTKSVDKSQIAPGEEVNFTISVKNTGDVALSNLTIEDSLPACALSAASGDNGNGIFEALETWVYTCALSPTDDVTNVVRATGRDPLGALWSDEDSAAVDVVKPALAIVKEASKTVVYPGETVHFTLRVRNQGNVTLSQVYVTDSMPACGLSRPRGDNGNRRLDPGEEWVYTCDVTFCKGENMIPDGGVDEVGAACTPGPSPSVCQDSTNIGKVTAKDPRGRTLTATDKIFIDLIRPGITVVKKANRTVVPAGTEVDFTIKVKNTGNTPLTNITVVDEQPACNLSGPTGDNGNGILDVGEKWVYTCSMAITGRTTNIATATGVDMLGNRWRDTGAVLVRTSCSCVTVAGVQDTEACLAAEGEVDAAFNIYLPMTRR